MRTRRVCSARIAARITSTATATTLAAPLRVARLRGEDFGIDDWEFMMSFSMFRNQEPVVFQNNGESDCDWLRSSRVR